MTWIDRDPSNNISSTQQLYLTPFKETGPPKQFGSILLDIMKLPDHLEGFITSKHTQRLEKKEIKVLKKISFFGPVGIYPFKSRSLLDDLDPPSSPKDPRCPNHQRNLRIILFQAANIQEASPLKHNG